jgi:hypothetical protein
MEKTKKKGKKEGRRKERKEGIINRGRKKKKGRKRTCTSIRGT